MDHPSTVSTALDEVTQSEGAMHTHFIAILVAFCPNSANNHAYDSKMIAYMHSVLDRGIFAAAPHSS